MAGSTEVSTAGAARTVRVTSSAATEPALGIRRTDPVYTPGVRPVAFTETLTFAGVTPVFAAAISQVAEVAKLDDSPAGTELTVLNLGGAAAFGLTRKAT